MSTDTNEFYRKVRCCVYCNQLVEPEKHYYWHAECKRNALEADLSRAKAQLAEKDAEIARLAAQVERMREALQLCKFDSFNMSIKDNRPVTRPEFFDEIPLTKRERFGEISQLIQGAEMSKSEKLHADVCSCLFRMSPEERLNRDGLLLSRCEDMFEQLEADLSRANAEHSTLCTQIVELKKDVKHWHDAFNVSEIKFTKKCDELRELRAENTRLAEKVEKLLSAARELLDLKARENVGFVSGVALIDFIERQPIAWANLKAAVKDTPAASLAEHDAALAEAIISKLKEWIMVDHDMCPLTVADLDWFASAWPHIKAAETSVIGRDATNAAVDTVRGEEC